MTKIMTQTNNIWFPPEWHTHERCWMAWPCFKELWQEHFTDAKYTYANIANTISHFESVTMLVHPSQVKEARRLLSGNVEILLMDINDSWMRDTGPTFVFNNKELQGIDWTFNGWGKFPFQQDQFIARNVLQHLSLDVISSDLVNEGGAIHTDGEGTLMVTKNVQLNKNRNPNLSQQDVEEKLKAATGCEKIIWFDYGLTDDHTDGHVDQFACFVAPQKIVVLDSDDPTDSNYSRLKSHIEQLRNETDAKGRPLDVVSIQQPSCELEDNARLGKSYINFYIANGGVIMPSYGEPETDQAAFDVLQSCFTDRQVVQVDCRTLVRGGGNIHCITQQQPKA